MGLLYLQGACPDVASSALAKPSKPFISCGWEIEISQAVLEDLGDKTGWVSAKNQGCVANGVACRFIAKLG